MALAVSHWPETELMFAGYLPDDRQLRIRYFWGATIGPGLPDSPSLVEAMAEDHPLEDRYRIEPLDESTSVGPEDVISLWEREGVLPGPMARQRVKQVNLVAITGEREVAGVSTVYLEHNRQLRMDLWYYRTFVGSAHRHTNVARHLISGNRDLLESRFTSGEDIRAAGMIFALEHEGMKRHLNTALWAHSRFVFIGEDQHGWHIRVYYFPAPRCPGPASRRRVSARHSSASTRQTLPSMNFIEDVMERVPASTLGIVAIDSFGNRREWHYGELIARSAGLSGAMAARGVEREDAVMTLVGSRIEWVLAMLACFRMGAVAMPCNPQLRRKDLEVRVRAANPKLCIGEEGPLEELPGGVPAMTMAEIADALDEDRPQETPAEIAELDPQDPAVIIFTSGTSGEPKGVLYPQRYLTGQHLQAEHWVGARKGELAWCTAAPGWSKSTRNAFIAPWLGGAAALLHDARFDPAERLGIVEREGVNVLCQAPTEYRILAKRTALRPVGSLRRMLSAGEPLNPGVIRAFREEMGIGIGDGYGQTETGAISGMRPDEDDPSRDGSMGRPLPGIEARVLEGELQVRPDTVPSFFSHYLGEQPFEGEWWPTGDHVREDEEGYLWFEGRDDDIIITAGYRVGPFEVESALVSHPAVAEAAAVPAPDEERGSVVRAIVVLADGEPSDELAAELQEHVKGVTAPYKYPRIVEFTDELPKTSSGKIRRAELRSPR